VLYNFAHLKAKHVLNHGFGGLHAKIFNAKMAFLKRRDEFQ
jgi:hypothetical protein